MLSNQDVLESKFRDLDLRVMALQVRNIDLNWEKMSEFFVVVTTGKSSESNGIGSEWTEQSSVATFRSSCSNSTIEHSIKSPNYICDGSSTAEYSVISSFFLSFSSSNLVLNWKEKQNSLSLSSIDANTINRSLIHVSSKWTWTYPLSPFCLLMLFGSSLLDVVLFLYSND